MKKQKICIIGGNLTGLVTAIGLSKLNCDIDLITGPINRKAESNRTIAISDDNFNFLEKINILSSTKNDLWPCTEMKLYTEIKEKKFSEIFQINYKNKKEKIFYVLKNIRIKKLMLEKIKKIKSISLINDQQVNDIQNSGLLKSIKLNNKNLKYNLFIICTGSKSSLVKNIFKNNFLENSYNEISVTAILSHKALKNNIARQVFLDEGIFALLPISNTKTSIVWTLKIHKYKKDNLILKKQIKFHAKNFLNQIKFVSNIECKNINFLIPNQYYKERVLLFGDALHVVHPFAGQGFNMTLRDLISLQHILQNKMRLGLDIGSLDILSEFSNDTKSRNFIYSMGLDLMKNSFSNKKIRDNAFKFFNESSLAKDIFYNIANKGLRF